jgi:ATP-dependent Clp protease adapter protein ClpS
VSILQEVFGQSKGEAKKTALLGHLNGNAVCGIYRRQVEAQGTVVSAKAIIHWIF